MSLIKAKPVTTEEFLEMKISSNEILELIDGIVYMSPSPSTKHQRVSGRLFVKLFNALRGNNCEVFSAPYDIHLHTEDIEDDTIVVPDISVICDKTGLDDNKFSGVPALIMEIVSPSNQSMDIVVKLNLYMKYGVKEYWIINPIINSIHVYTLNESHLYDLADVVKKEGIVKSTIINGFAVDAKELFA